MKRGATAYKAVEGAAETAGRRWTWIYSAFPLRAVRKGTGFLHRLIMSLGVWEWLSLLGEYLNRSKPQESELALHERDHLQSWVSINRDEKCWRFLTYPSLDKLARIFTEPREAWISVELCTVSETSTFSGNTCKPKSREERLKNRCKLDCVLVGLVEMFHVQTQHTYTYTTELWATPAGLGQGRNE